MANVIDTINNLVNLIIIVFILYLVYRLAKALNLFAGKWQDWFTETRPSQYAHTVKIGEYEFTEVEDQLIEKPTPHEAFKLAIEPVERMFNELVKAISREKENKEVEQVVKLTIPSETMLYLPSGSLAYTSKEEKEGIEEFLKKPLYIGW